MKRTLPCLVKRMRTGKPASPLTSARLDRHATRGPTRDGLAHRRRGPGPVPWLPPAGGTARRHHVLERVVGAHPAVVAGGPPAVGEPVRGQRRLPVVPEEVAVQAGGDVVPREDLVVGAVPGDVPVGVEALGRHRVEPAVELEALAPLLERAAGAPDALDDAPDPAVARDWRCPRRTSPRDRASGPARPTCGGRRAAGRTLRCSSSTPFWPNHWNGVCAFGTKPPTDAVRARLLRVLAPDLHDLARELGDAERVLVHLGGHADEEVELHPLPALRVRTLDGGVQVVLGDELVDHLADPPACRPRART